MFLWMYVILHIFCNGRHWARSIKEPSLIGFKELFVLVLPQLCSRRLPFLPPSRCSQCTSALCIKYALSYSAAILRESSSVESFRGFSWIHIVIRTSGFASLFQVDVLQNPMHHHAFRNFLRAAVIHVVLCGGDQAWQLKNTNYRVVDSEVLYKAIELGPQTTGQFAEQFGCHHSITHNYFKAIWRMNRYGKYVSNQLRR